MKHYAVIGVLAVLLAMAGCSAPAQETSASNAPEAAEASSMEASSSEAAESSDAESSAMETSSSAAENSSVESAEGKKGEAAQEDSELFAAEEWPDSPVLAEVPKPDFSVAPRSVSTHTGQVFIKYDNVPAAEVEKYIEDLKNAGFTYEASESKASDSYTYGAFNNEKVTEGTSISCQYLKDGSFSFSASRVDL